jgi:hypothetical protein
MINKEYIKKLASEGFSFIPCSNEKVPFEKEWTKSPPKKIEELDRLNPPLWGIRTGHNDLEGVDVDLKVLVSLTERKEWFDDFLKFLTDNVEDFLKKVVIPKTQKGGYHILYKTKVKQGNTKLAKLKGMTKALIETRGVGGQVIFYDTFYTDRKYHHIDYITDEERNIIINICKTYNYIDPITIPKPKQKIYKKELETDVTPWEDYNDKHTALDLINEDFTIVRNTTNSYVIKRHGAESPHSGYIFKDSGCMYLFSTGTIYPAETLLSPFSMYTIKYHFGDYSEATKDIYNKGYGTRRVKKIDIPEINLPDNKINRINFPIDIFPKEIQYFITESSESLGMSVDYMGCAFLWVMSLITGNAMCVEVKSGWREIATLWIAVVGKAGIGKTPSLIQMIKPLRKLNVEEQRQFQKKLDEYNEYKALSKEEKEHRQEIKKPRNKQFIVGDVTLEALIDLHEENPNSIGVFKDELAGWLKDMNKYRAGSDLEFWLSSWSGTPISLNRKTSKNAFVDKPFIPVIGGIQPSIFDDFSSGDNKENGFIDRILISYPELFVSYYSNKTMNLELMEWYADYIIHVKKQVENTLLKFDEQDQITPLIARFSKEAETEWIRIFNKITDIQNSDAENEYMKSMLPKQKSYIPRFALLLNTTYCFISDYEKEYDVEIIHKDSILRAEKLSEYFVNMAKLVKADSREKDELKIVSKDKSTTFEKFKAMYLANKELNKTTAAEMLDVSRKTIYQWTTKIDNE